MRVLYVGVIETGGSETCAGADVQSSRCQEEASCQLQVYLIAAALASVA